MTTEQIGVDTHDPAGMAAFLRARAAASRHFLTLTDEQQIRQFLEQWQKNVLPHFAFRFEQAAEMIDGLVRELAEVRAELATLQPWRGERNVRFETICGTCGQEHRLGSYYNHNFVARKNAHDATAKPTGETT